MTIAFAATDAIAFSEDRLSGSYRAHGLDRWIYAFTAASFVAIALAGFVPDSFVKIAGIRVGAHPPFPLALHFHAILMGGFLLLMFTQTMLVALGKRDWHTQLGVISAILIPALILSTLIAVPTVYQRYWGAAQNVSNPFRSQLQTLLPILDDILLLQLRTAILFPILMWVALRSRVRNPGMHKRLIFLASAPLLAAALDRIHWLPTTMPHSPLGSDLYTLLPIIPLFIWDMVRNRRLHPAYLTFAALYIPTTTLVYCLWDTAWWHATAPHIMGV